MQYESEQLTFDHEKLTPRGIYSFLRGIDTSVREVRDSLYDQERNTTSRFSRMEEELSSLKKEVLDLRISAGVTEHRLTELKDDVKGLREEVSELRGDMREMSGSFTAMQTRLNWWLVGVGIVIAVLQLWKG